MKNISTSNSLFLIFSVSILALSACSTHGASRYGETQSGKVAVPCGTVMVPCGPVIAYYPIPVQRTSYPVPTPCPIEQCPPTSNIPAVAQTPTVVEPAVIEEPPYLPPLKPEPPVVLPPRIERPVVDAPVITCPEGTIHSYGGQECISIIVPRK